MCKHRITQLRNTRYQVKNRVLFRLGNSNRHSEVFYQLLLYFINPVRELNCGE